MKKLGYIWFALIFNICRILSVKENKVVLFNGHNHGLNGNLKEIKKEMEQSDISYQFVLLAKNDIFGNGILKKMKGAIRFFINFPYQMATARYIFLNDNFLPLGYCKISRRAQVVQLWHGAGAFKKFGLSVETDEEVRRQVWKANAKITHLFVTSKNVVPIYEEAFAIPQKRIYPLGVPIIDVYSKEQIQKEGIERFYKHYPRLKDKKILLYTPTFRRSEEENAQIMSHFDVDRIHETLGDDWIILIKMHPKYPVDNVRETEYCMNLTNYSQITDLFFVSDMLVTDYSSTVVEYSLLDKPVVMYAYDLEEYDRGFYRDYESSVPGRVAHNLEEFLKYIVVASEESDRRRAFVNLQYDYKGGCCAQRILECLANTKEDNL